MACHLLLLLLEELLRLCLGQLVIRVHLLINIVWRVGAVDCGAVVFAILGVKYLVFLLDLRTLGHGRRVCLHHLSS